jgi:hypothetical protein
MIPERIIPGTSSHISLSEYASQVKKSFSALESDYIELSADDILNNRVDAS